MIIPMMKTITARLFGVCTPAKIQSAALNRLRDVVEARRLRVRREQEFYRQLNAYCLANNVSPLCEDDWKTGRP